MKFYTIATGTCNGKGSSLVIQINAKNRKEAMSFLDTKLFGHPSLKKESSDGVWSENVGNKTHTIDGYSGVYKKSELLKLRKEMKQILKTNMTEPHYYIGQCAVTKKLKTTSLVTSIVYDENRRLSSQEVADELLGKGELFDYFSPEGAKMICKLIKKKVKK